MHFEESLFDDFKSKRKTVKQQSPYLARKNEMRWFLLNSDDKTCDQKQSTYILKYKADYFYAQCEYEKALEHYQALLPTAPTTNTMLCHEINESIILCLKKMSRLSEAADAMKELIKADKTDASSWVLLSEIQNDRNDIKGAIFALQCCLEYHEEVANYWMKLARNYACLSSCFKLQELHTGCSFSNDNDNQTCYSQDILPGFHGLEEQDCEEYNTPLPKQREFDNDGKSDNTNDTGSQRDTEIVERISEITICNTTSTRQEELERVTSVSHPNKRAVLSTKEKCVNEVKHHCENHHYCFCTLCSLIIARFLHRKYSFHAPPLQSRKRNENLLRVNAMMMEIKCASESIVKTTEKLLNEKFAISSVDKSKHAYQPTTSNMSEIFGNEEMIKRIQDFETRWFPLL